MDESTQAPAQVTDIEKSSAAPRSSGGETRVNEQLTPELLSDIEKNKDVAAMSYVWILSIVVLYARKDSPFIQYHARQGMWLFLVSIPVWIIPRVGHYLEFIVLAGMIIGFINAAQGLYHDVPLIGQLAKGTLTLRDLWKKVVAGVVQGVGVLKRGVGLEKTEIRSGKAEVGKEVEKKEIRETSEIREDGELKKEGSGKEEVVSG